MRSLIRRIGHELGGRRLLARCRELLLSRCQLRAPLSKRDACGRGRRARLLQALLFLLLGNVDLPMLIPVFYRIDDSISVIQSGLLRISRGLEPSAGPTSPSRSIMSIRCAARP